VVPTLEEKIIAEHRPPKTQVTDEPTGDKVEGTIGPDSTNNGSARNGSPPEARTPGGELYGSPANTSSTLPTKDGPPRVKLATGDKDQNASRARSVIRKQLANKLGDKTWTLPTPKPHVDPQGFKDPITDEFWLNVWAASAVHNVRFNSHGICADADTESVFCRLKFIEKYFTPYQTT
jgi:phospholipase D1/2